MRERGLENTNERKTGVSPRRQRSERHTLDVPHVPPAPGRGPSQGMAGLQQRLLQLQRQLGNGYVQRMVNLAHSSRVDSETITEVEQGIERARGGGQALDGGLRAQMEQAFGADFGEVRIHTGAEADRLNRAVGARAFTTESDIFFRDEEYNPGNPAGRELLAHELTHVVQQAAAPLRRTTANGPTGLQRQEATETKTPATPAASTETAPVEDATINALDLAPTAKTAAQTLKSKHPEITFTSGRRDLAGQASAMASNVVSGGRDWIKNTYTSAQKLQKWVDDHPEAKTKDEIAKGLESTLNGMTASEQAGVSKHITGEAFDVQPQAKDADAIKADIKALPGITKFLEKESGLVRWHAQFKLTIGQMDDSYEQEADSVARAVVRQLGTREGAPPATPE